MYLHILDPIIEKYSIFLTIIILRIISNKERFSTINETLLSNPEQYLSIEEVLKICIHEHILSHDDILRICRETFPTDINDRQISSIDSSLENIHKKSFVRESEERLNSNETDIPLWYCYIQNMDMYAHDSIRQKQLEQTFIIAIFDYILYFNHQTIINGQLRRLFKVFTPLSMYTAQLLIEKEMSIIQLLLKARKQQSKLTIHDLNRYLQSYPIPCRL